MDVKLIDTPTLLLGEGTVWNSYTKSLFFVDIKQGLIYDYSKAKGTLKSYSIGGQVGFLVVQDFENIVCAKDNTLVKLNLKAGKITNYAQFGLKDYQRFNDGKCDASGRIWADVMVSDVNSEKFTNGGCLMCIENKKAVFTIDNMTIPNGMDWLDTKFYHTDTVTNQIFEYTVKDNSIVFNKVAIDLTKEKGSPDGFCADSNGNIWVAMWGGYCILCCDPKTGEILKRIQLPDENVSCCTFGGENLNELYVTSAQDEKGNGGHLYCIKTDVKGRLPNNLNSRRIK